MKTRKLIALFCASFVLTTITSGQDTLKFERTTTIQTLENGNINIATNPIVLQQTLDSIYTLHARMADSLQSGTVTGTSKFLRLLETLETGGDVLVGGDLEVIGSATIGGTTFANGGLETTNLETDNITVSENGSFGQDVSVGGTLTVTGATTLNSTLSAQTSTLSSATITGDASIGGNTSMTGALDVDGSSELDGLNVDGATTLDAFTADGNADINGNADVSGTLNAGASTLSSATVTGNTTVGGDFTVDGSASLSSLQINVASPTALPADADNATDQKNSHAFSVDGGYQGIYVNLKTTDDDTEVDDDQHFLTFAKDNEAILGTIEGNQSVSSIADLLSNIGSALASSDSSASGGGASCYWSFDAWELNPNSPHAINDAHHNKYLLFFVEGAPLNVFSTSADITWFGTYGYEGAPISSSAVKDNGDCKTGGANCYQAGYFQVYDTLQTHQFITSTTNEFPVFSNYDVSIQYLEQFKSTRSANSWGHSAMEFTWSLFGGNGSKQFKTTDDPALGYHMAWHFAHWGNWATGNDNRNPDPLPNFIGSDESVTTSKHYYLSGTNCPDPEGQEGNEGIDGANATQEAEAQAVADNVDANDIGIGAGDVIDAVDELIMILSWCKSIQELIFVFFPPGTPFDFWDIFDAIFGVFTESWGVGMNYWAASQAVGVAFASGGADYAEWLERAYPNEVLLVGDVVGVKAGRISKTFINADEFMVVSGQPIILGNTPPAGRENFYEKVAFLGQVPVKVIGPVKEGDYILFSGEADGVAIAKDKSEIRLDDYKHIIGVAWEGTESVAGGLPTFVNVAIGLNHNELAEEVKKLKNALLEVQSVLVEAGFELDLAFDSEESSTANNQNQLSGKPGQSQSINTNMAHSMLDDLNINEAMLLSGLSENEEAFLQGIIKDGLSTNVQERHQFARIADKIVRERFGTGFIDNEDFRFIHTIMTDPNRSNEISKELGSITAAIEALLMEVNPNPMEFGNEPNKTLTRKK